MVVTGRKGVGGNCIDDDERYWEPVDVRLSFSLSLTSQSLGLTQFTGRQMGGGHTVSRHS